LGAALAGFSFPSVEAEPEDVESPDPLSAANTVTGAIKPTKNVQSNITDTIEVKTCVHFLFFIYYLLNYS
jgi:hypothetical protein